MHSNEPDPFEHRQLVSVQLWTDVFDPSDDEVNKLPYRIGFKFFSQQLNILRLPSVSSYLSYTVAPH